LLKDIKSVPEKRSAAVKIPDPKDIRDYLDQHVVGQDQAKLVLSVAIANHCKRISQSDRRITKANILIIGPTGTVTLSTSDHNVDTTWYEFTVTVTDTSGLSTTRSASIKPNLVALTFTSSETGATYTIDGIPHSGIHTEQAVVGVVRELDVPSPQVVDGAELTFSSWSDGGTKQHQISTPATDTTYTVTFDRTASPA
jgi:hypothetical protein